MIVVVPMSFRDVCRYIALWHRHNKPPRGGKVFIGVRDGRKGPLLGVAVLGRPSARAYDPEEVAEVTRTCTNGHRNVNSKLYGACRRIAKGMGYLKVITYTQEGEDGSSLRASGFVLEQELKPRKNWAQSSSQLRHLRDETEPSGVKRFRWSITFEHAA